MTRAYDSRLFAPVKRSLPPFRYITCPANGHQVSWCRGLCRPIKGIGYCGRVAPHAMVDRTQRAIAEAMASGLEKRIG